MPTPGAVYRGLSLCRRGVLNAETRKLAEIRRDETRRKRGIVEEREK
jgi:hypothetical protein